MLFTFGARGVPIALFFVLVLGYFIFKFCNFLQILSLLAVNVMVLRILK
jgi:hypothetical protein